MIRGINRTTEGESRSDNLPLLSFDQLDRGQLRIASDKQSKTIRIEENPHKHPFSWFLTHPSGKLFLSGRIESSDHEIKLLDIESGVYHFRAQGEVYEINVA